MRTPAARPPRQPALHAVALAALTALTTLAACRTAPRVAPAPTTGDAVLRAMRERYDGKWYRTLSFAQRTVQVLPNGTERRVVWQEAMAIPGRLRIETDSTGRNGRLFARDSQFVILNNAVRFATPGYNVLLVLGFDVYAQPPARTAEMLRELGFPAGPVREDTWDGRPAYVVGGAPGDLHSPQYWVDKERLVFVRLLQPSTADTTKTLEVRFNKYRPLGEAWIAPEVEELVDGRRTLHEEYVDVRANPPLPDALFDPRSWSAASIRRP